MRSSEGNKEKMGPSTLVDSVKLGDDVEADFGELVLEELEEEREEDVDGVVLAEDRGEAANLLGEGGANMLGGVSDEVFDAREDGVEDSLLGDEGREPRNLRGGSGLDLCLSVLEEPLKAGHKLVLGNLGAKGFRQLFEEGLRRKKYENKKKRKRKKRRKEEKEKKKRKKKKKGLTSTKLSATM